jgi:predicted lipoprotein with Yx(FWY)xxD motif
MGSNRRLMIGAASTFALTLALSACGSVATPAGPASSASPSAGLIHTTSMKVGDKTETVLKNQKGLTLYYFMPDTATTAACTGGCAGVWPPLVSTSGTPSSDPALPGTLTIVNDANGAQVAYNGHPLYNYSKDGAPGDANGQGIGGKWFVATPDLAAAAATPKPSTSGYTPAY